GAGGRGCPRTRSYRRLKGTGRRKHPGEYDRGRLRGCADRRVVLGRYLDHRNGRNERGDRLVEPDELFALYTHAAVADGTAVVLAKHGSLFRETYQRPAL